MIEKERLCSPQMETCFVGCLYKDPSLFTLYNDRVSFDYDFSDEVPKFLYACFETMFKTSEHQVFDENKINIFMTKDEDRLLKYKKYGGYKTISTIMSLCDIDEVERYFNEVKKYSLLREYNAKGIDVTAVVEHKSFDYLTAEQVFKFVNDKVNKIYTNISQTVKSDVLTKGTLNMVHNCLKVPQVGKRMPFPLMSSMFLGMKPQKLFGFGMLSNLGKTRMLTEVVAHLALIEGENCALLLNEMTEDQVKACLLTTVINNPAFEAKHGVHLTKQEMEITSGLYKDDDSGVFIERPCDDWGEFISDEAYVSYVREHSEEFRKVEKIANWLENEISSKIIIKDVCKNYSDTALEREIKTTNMTNGVKFFFYDTLKDFNENIGKWEGMIHTTDMLKTLANTLNIFIMFTFQLTDDTVNIDPYDLSSMNIANSKHIKHLVDGMVLSNEIYTTNLSNYQYRPTPFEEDGVTVIKQDNVLKSDFVDIIPKDKKKYYIFVMDKNRDGGKKKLLIEVDLNLNTWTELGEMIRKPGAKVSEFTKPLKK